MLARGQTNAFSHGSYLGWPAEAANLLTSKPVMLGLGPLLACNVLSKSWYVRGLFRTYDVG